MVLIKDIMQKKVVTIAKNKNIYDASTLMSAKGISCLVVTEKSKIVGIITRRDILEKVMIQKLNPEKTIVMDMMTSPVRTIDKKLTLVYAAGMMNAAKIKQVPVVSKEKLVGIVTQTDVVRNVNAILGVDIPNLGS